jgi:hypothetical protein
MKVEKKSELIGRGGESIVALWELPKRRLSTVTLCATAVGRKLNMKRFLCLFIEKCHL